MTTWFSTAVQTAGCQCLDSFWIASSVSSCGYVVLSKGERITANM